ncbi:MAG: class I SAM-dependent rRNA methyltransferase [Proteobacteria bacterium]|nr:class I SAM-dependent rRNA methyltransferase [Pseudomonadota bacterium]
MSYKKVILKKGREVPVKNHHHWIFSGAVENIPDYENGEILAVYSFDNHFLGHAYFNKTTDIAGRMINFDDSDPVESLKQNILEAIKFREGFFDKSTNCFRLINGEGDAVPGLIVDKYNDVLVVQISTWGIEKLKQEVLTILKDFYKDKISSIYERSDISSRKREGLQNVRGFLFGQEKDLIQEKGHVEVLENGIKFDVDFINGQKTGLFMDMREMRRLVMDISNKKRVLNCFCYTGAFSLYALKGGAKSVTSVDISKDAIEAVKINFELNKFNNEKNPAISEDVFDFLRKESLDYDLIILDPPAFAKKKSDLDNAKKAYYEINKTAFSKMPGHSMLLTCSCSYHIDELTFERIIAKAAKDAGRNIKIASKHRLTPDHPINIYHPELDYLKSMLIYVV